MRWLILSDIHANVVALEAVIRSAGTVKGAVCLWDIVGYGPRPNESCEYLRDLGAFCVAGNHDLAIANGEWIRFVGPEVREASEWTGHQLTDVNRRFLCELPTFYEHEIGILMHGTPWNVYEIQLHGTKAREATLEQQALASWGTETPEHITPGVTGFRGERELKRQVAANIHCLVKDIRGGWQTVEGDKYPLRGTLVLTTHRLMVIGTTPRGPGGALGMWKLGELGELGIDRKLKPPLLRFRRPGGNLGELIPLNAGVDVSDAAGWLRAIQEARAAAPQPLTER